MKHLISISDFINERNSFGNFKNNLVYTDWTDFKNRLKAVIEEGYSDIEDLVTKMGMDYSKYETIIHNSISNWIDSISKSTLHTIADLNLKIPKAGTKIFNNEKNMQRFLLIAGRGQMSRNVFGDTNITQGLRMIPHFEYEHIEKLSPERYEQLLNGTNEIIKYVWLYRFFHHRKLKTDKIKLPKYLYRAIRLSDLLGQKQLGYETAEKESYYKSSVRRYDANKEYILKNGLKGIAKGKFLSFTSSQSIAEYFVNGEGIIVRVDPKKVKIVTSELTDSNFAEPNWHNDKKEREYVVDFPADYKFSPEDIEIHSSDYYVGKMSPLAVAHFDHDNLMAFYTMNGVKFRAYYAWSSNTKGSVGFSFEYNDRNYYHEGVRNATKILGFNPMPTEKTLGDVKDFVIKKYNSWASSDAGRYQDLD